MLRKTTARPLAVPHKQPLKPKSCYDANDVVIGGTYDVNVFVTGGTGVCLWLKSFHPDVPLTVFSEHERGGVVFSPACPDRVQQLAWYFFMRHTSGQHWSLKANNGDYAETE